MSEPRRRRRGRRIAGLVLISAAVAAGAGYWRSLRNPKPT